jgi:hypothetical protein
MNDIHDPIDFDMLITMIARHVYPIIIYIHMTERERERERGRERESNN